MYLQAFYVLGRDKLFCLFFLVVLKVSVAVNNICVAGCG